MSSEDVNGAALNRQADLDASGKFEGFQRLRRDDCNERHADINSQPHQGPELLDAGHRSLEAEEWKNPRETVISSGRMAA